MAASESTVFLWGLPGSGKTTIGKLLSASLGLPFVDLDEVIVMSEGAAISSIFEEKGEDYFRETERASLHSIIEARQPSIVSTGGGTPCFFDNIKIMNMAGITCYLRTSWSQLATRVSPGQSVRPLFKGLSQSNTEFHLKERFSWRLPYYEKAAINIDTEEKTAFQIRDEVLALLRK